MGKRSDPLFGVRPKALDLLEKQMPEVAWRPLLHWLRTDTPMLALVKSEVFREAGFPQNPAHAQTRIEENLVRACALLEPVFVKARYGADREDEQAVMEDRFHRRDRGSLDSAPIVCRH